jgi:hypothetical protein
VNHLLPFDSTRSFVSRLTPHSASLTPLKAPISMTKTPQRGGILYQIDITSLVDDLNITGAELNRGNCTSYVVVNKSTPNESPKIETIFKEGTQFSVRTGQMFAMINATRVNSINLKFSEMATILYEGSCNVLEA